MKTGARNPLVGRVELEKVQIQQIGSFNTERKYWPVRAKVTTKATRQEAQLSYEVFLNDYNEWTARLAER